MAGQLTLNAEEIEALRAVLDYNWADEEHDYKKSRERGNTDERHVFHSLRTLSKALGRQSSQP